MLGEYVLRSSRQKIITSKSAADNYMHLEGSFDTPASRTTVWELLLNSREMVTCFPDVQSFEVLTEETFRANVRVGVSVIKRTMNFDFRIADKVPAKSARLVGNGRGGGTTVELQIGFTLDETSSGTKVAWTTDVIVRGSLAALGTNLLDSLSGRMVAEVLDRLKSKLQERAKA